MPRQTKNQKELISKVDPNKTYTLREASSLVKEITFTKFDASIDWLFVWCRSKKSYRDG